MTIATRRNLCKSCNRWFGDINPLTGLCDTCAGPTAAITYDTVTPESAEVGDFADSGFLEEPHALEPGELRDLIGEFRRSVEPSSLHPHPGDWWTECDGTPDYQTGAVTRRSLHISGVTAATFARINRALCPDLRRSHALGMR